MHTSSLFIKITTFLYAKLIGVLNTVYFQMAGITCLSACNSLRVYWYWRSYLAMSILCSRYLVAFENQYRKKKYFWSKISPLKCYFGKIHLQHFPKQYFELIFLPCVLFERLFFSACYHYYFRHSHFKKSSLILPAGALLMKISNAIVFWNRGETNQTKVIFLVLLPTNLTCGMRLYCQRPIV